MLQMKYICMDNVIVMYYGVNTEMTPQLFGLWTDILLTLDWTANWLTGKLSANGTQTTYRSTLLTQVIHQ